MGKMGEPRSPAKKGAILASLGAPRRASARSQGPWSSLVRTAQSGFCGRSGGEGCSVTKNGLGPQRAKSVGTEHGCPPSPARRATAKGMRHSTCNGDFGLLFCDLMGFTACDVEAGNPIPKTRHPRAMVFLRASEATSVPHRQPGRFVQRNPTRQTEIPHSHGMDSKAKMISQSTANENDDRSQSLPRWLKLNRSLSATERANLPASCCHGLAFSRRRSGDLEPPFASTVHSFTPTATVVCPVPSTLQSHPHHPRASRRCAQPTCRPLWLTACLQQRGGFRHKSPGPLWLNQSLSLLQLLLPPRLVALDTVYQRMEFCGTPPRIGICERRIPVLTRPESPAGSRTQKRPRHHGFRHVH